MFYQQQYNSAMTPAPTGNPEAYYTQLWSAPTPLQGSGTMPPQNAYNYPYAHQQHPTNYEYGEYLTPQQHLARYPTRAKPNVSTVYQEVMTQPGGEQLLMNFRVSMTFLGSQQIHPNHRLSLRSVNEASPHQIPVRDDGSFQQPQECQAELQQPEELAWFDSNVNFN